MTEKEARINFVEFLGTGLVRLGVTGKQVNTGNTVLNQTWQLARLRSFQRWGKEVSHQHLILFVNADSVR